MLHATWRMTLSGEIPSGLAASIGVLALGYGMAALLGVPAGLMLGRYRLLAFTLDPYVDALLAVPSLLLVPVFFGLFGLGRETQVAVVFLYSFVVIVTMTRSGLATLDPAHADMARAFGASERQIFREVLLPGSLPTVMAGLRLGIGRAVRALINAEMLIGPAGLGALLRQYGTRFDAASVYGILIVVIALALGRQLRRASGGSASESLGQLTTWPSHFRAHPDRNVALRVYDPAKRQRRLKAADRPVPANRSSKDSATRCRRPTDSENSR